MHNFSLYSEYIAKHRVYLTSQRLQNLLLDRIVEGQRAYIGGFIGYSEFKCAEGFRKHSGWIMANTVFLCEKNDDSFSGDFQAFFVD